MSKYKNPIMKVETVKIPTWEYAALVRASTLLEITENLVNGGISEYQVRDVLKALYGDGEDKEGDG